MHGATITIIVLSVVAVSAVLAWLYEGYSKSVLQEKLRDDNGHEHNMWACTRCANIYKNGYDEGERVSRKPDGRTQQLEKELAAVTADADMLQNRVKVYEQL